MKLEKKKMAGETRSLKRSIKRNGDKLKKKRKVDTNSSEEKNNDFRFTFDKPPMTPESLPEVSIESDQRKCMTKIMSTNDEEFVELQRVQDYKSATPGMQKNKYTDRFKHRNKKQEKRVQLCNKKRKEASKQNERKSKEKIHY